MTGIGIWPLAGIIFVVLLISAAGIYSGRHVSSSRDFTSGGAKEGRLMVAGTITGTLVSSQSTVGSAQMAFLYGLSAWWYTLGAGIGCLILALVFSPALRKSKDATLSSVISDEYGHSASYMASILSAVGIFISVFSQIIAFSALVTSIFPLRLWQGAVLGVLVMALYVMFGGIWGAGLGGIIKTVLLYLSAITAGVLVVLHSGSVSRIFSDVRDTMLSTGLGELNGIQTGGDFAKRFCNILARGPFKDFGAALSVVMGVLSTQTYASAVWAAKNDKEARRGALLSSALIPPIGIACIFIGLYMRSHALTQGEADALAALGKEIPGGLIVLKSSAQVFPAFILHTIPGIAGGIVLGTLLVTIVGGGAGLALGVSTILVNDLALRALPSLNTPKKSLLLSRAAIVLVLLLSALVAVLLPSAVINEFGYMSMGLRACVIFAPLCAALWFPGRISAKFAVLSIIISPVVDLVFGMIKVLPFDSLFAGMFASLIVMGAGFMSKAGFFSKKR